MNTYLPEFSGLIQGLRKGRNVYEGYQRGWGLQFGNLRQEVLADPLYKEALRLLASRTILDELHRMNIFLVLKFCLKNVEAGHIIEFGSYRGGNAIFMAFVVQELMPGTMVYGLDTFEGMPQTDKSVDAHNKGDFSDIDLDELRQYVEKLGLRNLEWHKGYFEDTATKVLQRAEKISLAHIDCDIYSSVRFAYEAVKPCISNGGYVIFDDATVSSCIGATEVVEEVLIRRDGLNSEQIFPQFVFRLWNGRA